MMPTKKYVLMLCLVASCMSEGIKASCCSSASSGGIGSLLAHERAYVEFFNDSTWVTGSFDEQGRFHGGSPAHLPHWLLNQELHVMARVARFFLPFVKLPARTRISQISVNTELADLTLGARFPLAKEGFIEMGPAISLLSSVRIQTASPSSSLMALGLALEKGFGPVSVSLSYSLGAEPNYFKNKGFSNGIMQSASLGASFRLNDNAKISLGISPTFYSSARVNGANLPYTSKRSFAVSAGYSWNFHSHLTLNTGLGAHLPLNYLGKKTNTEVFAQAGLRIGVF